LGPIVATRAVLAEWLGLTMLLLAWPFGLLRWPDHSAVAGTNHSIVLIHGWGLNAASLWLLRRRLVARGCGSVRIFTYSTRRVDVERAAERLRDFLAELQRECPTQVTLIGHSLGGLVARYCLRRYPAHGVRRLITLGTPHHGTSAARVGYRIGRLVPESPLLRRLNTGDHVPDQFEVIAISSSFDALVTPPGNADYPGAFNIRIRDVGHNALLFSPRVFTLIAENLGSAVAAPAAQLTGR
ncbi:MAG TPA: alpha/beta fold hydrolase, partial [Candidatus Kryptonia bacterium]|nr:alpha/beta fold hydrolase [Candidatus Kryptonia bacterium]